MWIVACCCLAAMGEGVDIQAPGVTLPVLAPLFHLTGGEGFIAGLFSGKSLFASAGSFGLMIGSLIGGRASDLLGRKWVTAASVALFALLSAVTAQATSADMLLWARFCTGLGLGGALPNLLAIVSETVSPARRHAAVGCIYAFMPTGGAIVSLSSYAFGDSGHWRYIYYLGALIPALSLPGLIMAAPGARPARAVVRPSARFALFGQDRAAPTVTLWICFLFALITQFILLSWLPSLLIAKGLPRTSAAIVQIGFNLLAAVGSVLACIAIDRTNRARTTAFVFLGGVVSLGVLAVAPASLSASVAVGSLAGFAVAGTQAICYALAPGLYPTCVRGTGVGFAVAFGRIGAVIGPLLAGALVGAGAAPAAVLLITVPLMIVAGACAVLVSRAPSDAEPVAAAAALA